MKKVFCALLLVYAVYHGVFAQTSGDFVIEGTVLTSYTGSAAEVVIPANLGITAIGFNAFGENDRITSVVIPEGVTSIENFAFGFCKGLTRVSIPESVTTIGMTVFAFCTSLTSITIPASVTSVGDYAFVGCYSTLAPAVRDNLVARFGESIFYDPW